jgi:hypothetical protein
LRIRRPDLADDTLTLPLQRLREEVSELIKVTEDKDTGQELLECNRRLIELREDLGLFLSQSEEDSVYWVERAGRTQRNLSLNAAPVDVAAYLRHRLFGADTSVILTSATLSTPERRWCPRHRRRTRRRGSGQGASQAGKTDRESSRIGFGLFCASGWSGGGAVVAGGFAVRL